MSHTVSTTGFKQPSHSYRLAAFLLAAAVLHLCLMLFVPEKLGVITRPLGDLSLSFSSNNINPASTESDRKASRHKNQDGDQHNPRRDYLAVPDQNSNSSTASTDNETGRFDASQLPQSGNNVQSVRRQLLGVITSNLSKHLVYPPVARQRGWQGEVRLTVDVNHTGELKNVQIARSSGHRLLDMSAKKALSDVRQVAMATDWQGRSYTNMMIPVRYQLNSQ